MRLIFLLVLILVSTSSVNAQEAVGAKSEKGELVLGVIVPLTGPLAFFGKDFIRAYDLASESRPELKNAFQVKWEDSAYDSKQSVSAFNKLLSVNNADVILSFGGPMLSALAPLAEEMKVPFFATESEKKDCENRKYCSLFRNEEREWGKATWRMLRSKNKKRIGIIKNQNQFMNTFVNGIIDTKGESEEVEVLLDLSPDATELRSDMLSLRGKDVDTLGVFLLPRSHHGFLRGLRALNKHYTLFGVEEFLVKENNRGFESFTDGALVVAPWATEEYRNTFESRYGYSAGFFYTPAFYDFLNLLADILASKGSIRGLDLVNAMHFKGVREGVSGKFHVSVSEKGVHSYSFPIAVYQVQSGETVISDVYEF